MNWNRILNRNLFDVIQFAEGTISGRELRRRVTFTPVSGEVKRLLEERGVTYARRLARKALRRRNYLVSTNE